MLAKIRAGETIDHYDTTRRRKDGSLLSISLTVSPVGASKIARDITERSRLLAVAGEQAAITQRLGDVGAALASTLDRDAIVQKVIDTARELTHAEFGAFVYEVRQPQTGHADVLYALLVVPTEGFAGVLEPRAAAVFGATLPREGTVRLEDATRHPGHIDGAVYLGLPASYLPVRSYLAVPVKGVYGDVLGNLSFGHSQVGVFTDQHRRLAGGIAAWASVALENSRLFADAQDANRMCA